MTSTETLVEDFKFYLAQGFSIPNARRLVENFASGPKQRERLREALDRLIAEKEGGDDKDVGATRTPEGDA